MVEEKVASLVSEFQRSRKPFTDSDVELAAKSFDKYGDIATIIAIRCGLRGKNFVFGANLGHRVGRYAFALQRVAEEWHRLHEKLKTVASPEEFEQKKDIIEREYYKYGFVACKLYGKRPFADAVDASIERLTNKRLSPTKIILRKRDIVFVGLASRLATRFPAIKAANYVYEYTITKFDDKTRSFKKEAHWEFLSGPEMVFGAILIRRYPEFYPGIFQRCLKHIRNYNQFGILIGYALNFGPTRFHSMIDTLEKKRYMIRDFCAGVFASLRHGMKDYVNYISEMISWANEHSSRIEKVERVTKAERFYEVTDGLFERVAKEYPDMEIEQDEIIEIRPDFEDALMNTKFSVLSFSKNKIKIPSSEELELIRARTKTLIGYITIERILIKKFSEITDDDAMRDGFKNKTEMQSRYKQIFTGIEDNDFISIYHLGELKVE